MNFPFFSFSVQAKGLGYAINTAEELNFVREVAESTGVVLDPVYRYVNTLVKSIVCAHNGRQFDARWKLYFQNQLRVNCSL